MKLKIAMLLCVCWAAATAAPAQILESTNLRCEYRADPLGIETPRPRLSWEVRATQRGQAQAAYQIQVRDNQAKIVWDSGKFASGESALIPYGGEALKSQERYAWRVRVWPALPVGGEASAWSGEASWTMGLLTPGDWTAKWISCDVPADPDAKDAQGKPLPPPLPIFRKTFSVKEVPLKKAIVYVCGLGQYELSVNGGKSGDAALDPGWTDYKKRCLYATHDVTRELSQGTNAVGVMLGNGMYNVAGGRYTKFKGSFGAPKLILQLRLEYKDGTSETIVSDGTWKAAAGPIRFSCIYGGEDYDARLEQAGWDTPKFDDTAWSVATVTDGPGGALVAQAQPPAKVREEFKSVKTTQPRPGVTVYDLGRNFSGWPALKVSGPAGAVVKITPGELLDKDGLVTQRSSGGPTYFSYTLKGQGEEAWHPRFSYYGFRYAQAETRPAVADGKMPDVGAVSGQFIHSSAETVGTFECSNPLVNKIHALIDAAIQSNLQSVLTDCPHREKLGWLEVSHLLGQAVMFNYDVPNFYAKICRDMADAQTPEGLVPDIAPEYTVFKGGFRDSPEWGSASVINPWLVYQMYGDDALLREHYGMMARYVDYLGSKAKEGIISYGLGDWYDIGPKGPGVSQLTSLGVTATAVWYQDVTIMERAAGLLGKAEDAKKYAALARRIREAFNKTYFHPESATYDRGSQTAAAMPLVVGLAPEGKRKEVVAALVKAIRDGGCRVTAGDVGFHYLVAALEEAGEGELLYGMLTQREGPGYAYQVSRGATTLTEAWDTNPRSSQNHCMLGHAEEWLYRGLGGIAPAAPGFRRIRIRPAVVAGLEWARASYDSVRGKIECAWKREGGAVKIEVTVPVGATAEVHVPAKSAEAVRESGQALGKAEGVKFLRMEGGAAVCEVGAGRYAFEAKE